MDLSKTREVILMNGSDYLRLFAAQNRKAGYTRYAEILDNAAAVYEAGEILKEETKKGEKI